MDGIMIDYVKVLSRWNQYRAAQRPNLRELPRILAERLGWAATDFTAVTQANTGECQCQLLEGDVLYNFVAKTPITNGLIGLFPGGYTDREIIDETFLGGISIATLLQVATDAEWAGVCGAS